MAQDTKQKVINTNKSDEFLNQIVHPEIPGAIGSRNSIYREGRDEYKEAKLVLDEEVDKVLNHIHAKLPPEVLEHLDVMGSVKSKLHNYFNQDFQNMLNRYLVTMEDEMAKKFGNLVDKEEKRILERYTPREITDLLSKSDVADDFNTREVETSVVSMYEHLQQYIDEGVEELERHTNSVLQEKTDVGAFIQGENSYAIAKCVFQDNSYRPQTVMNVKLSISIREAELISPIYHYQLPVAEILKDLVAKHVHTLIDAELKTALESLSPQQNKRASITSLFERLRIMEKYVSDEDTENSKRYQIVAKKFFTALDSLQNESPDNVINPLRVRESVVRILDRQDVRNRGFNTAVNALSSILNHSKMGYQFLENSNNARECIIREYQEENPEKLPDEYYAIRLVYYDYEQLTLLRENYSKQLVELEEKIIHLWKVCKAINKKTRLSTKEEDWDTLVTRITKQTGDKTKKTANDVNLLATEEKEETEQECDEFSFIRAEETFVTKANPTVEGKLSNLKERFVLMKKNLDGTYGMNYTQERSVIEERMTLIEKQFDEFCEQINPYHIQPGLVLDIDLVSIKKRKNTMIKMANVINEFLHSVSKGFAEIPSQEDTIKEKVG